MSIIKSPNDAQRKRPNAFDSLRHAAKNVMSYGGKLCILADTSGSMADICRSGKEAVSEVEDAARSIVAKYITRVDVDLITFGGGSARRTPGAAIPHLHAHGGTPMAAAIIELKLDSPGTQAILMSDGAPDSELHVRNEVNTCVGRHVIHTLAIGECANHELMKWIAKVTGGKYYTIADAIDLPVAMMAIASHAVAALTGGIEDAPNLPKQP